jgi:glutathione S-transferase
MLTIHNFPNGARGLRVMWLCEEMGLPYRVQHHPFPVGEAYRALNPLGTVPLLEDGENAAINESIAIMLYIAQRFGPTPLLPNDARLAKCLQLTMFGETEIGMILNPLLAAHFMAGKADKQNWSVLRLEQRLAAAIDHADNLLAGNEYFVETH